MAIGRYALRTMAEDQDIEVGGQRVGVLVENLGALGARTLADLTGHQLTGDLTPMVRKCVTAWTVPLADLTWEQVRLLVGQGLGMPWTSTLALELLRRRPDVTVTLYPGDLSRQILRRFSEVFAADPQGARMFLNGDFRWIDTQEDIAAKSGGISSSDARHDFLTARKIAFDS